MRAFIGILLLSWLGTFFLPWWILFLPAFIFGAWLIEKPLSAIVIGFSGTGFAWFLQALYIHIANDAIAAIRVAEMMGIGSPWLVLVIILLVGGLPGAAGAVTGCLLKLNLKKNPETAAA
ncbi:MAG: hypothetical protein EA391_11255 [Balneolaceae bacterium]|nr:MAG: hypothetical protein EA391_11255 [Balneolaceae bacterium]